MEDRLDAFIKNHELVASGEVTPQKRVLIRVGSSDQFAFKRGPALAELFVSFRPFRVHKDLFPDMARRSSSTRTARSTHSRKTPTVSRSASSRCMRRSTVLSRQRRTAGTSTWPTSRIRSSPSDRWSCAGTSTTASCSPTSSGCATAASRGSVCGPARRCARTCATCSREGPRPAAS